VKTTQLTFTKFGGQVHRGPRKNLLDFGDNPNHITLALGLLLMLMSHLPGLRDSYSHPPQHWAVGMFTRLCLIVVKVGCWALAETVAAATMIMTVLFLLANLSGDSLCQIWALNVSN